MGNRKQPYKQECGNCCFQDGCHFKPAVIQESNGSQRSSKKHGRKEKSQMSSSGLPWSQYTRIEAVKGNCGIHKGVSFLNHINTIDMQTFWNGASNALLHYS